MPENKVVINVLILLIIIGLTFQSTQTQREAVQAFYLLCGAQIPHLSAESCKRRCPSPVLASFQSICCSQNERAQALLSLENL